MEINSFEDILRYCREMNATIPEVMIEYEVRKRENHENKCLMASEKF